MNPGPFVGASFSGHESFPFRYTWLKKGVEAVRNDPRVFGREDAMVELGVGKNMVYAIRHWGLAVGTLEEDPSVPNNRGRQLRVTARGQSLFGPKGWDPFLEDPATPWLLHWFLAATPESATTWYWVFNHLAQREFTKEDLLRGLQGVVEAQKTVRATHASLSRDVDCFLRTYVAGRPTRTVPIEDTLDCPLVDLGLIHEGAARGTYVLTKSRHPNLPDEVVLFAVQEFLRSRKHSTSTVSLEVLLHAPGSPGRVFCFDEDGLISRLERFGKITEGALSFDETAGLRQLLITREVEAMEVLADYYAQARKAVHHSTRRAS